MKTVIAAAVALFISLSINAQINKYNIKKSSLSVKPTTTLKLPLLKAKSTDRYQEGDINNLKEIVLSNQNISIEPKAYSTSSNGLNILLNFNNMRVSEGGIGFRGQYNSKGIQIRKRFRDLLGVYFKAKRSKTYRIKLKFYMKYNDYCNKSMQLYMNLGDASHFFNVKKGANHLDFLIRSDVDGNVIFYPLTSYNVRCGNSSFTDKNLKFKFLSCEIKELQD